MRVEPRIIEAYDPVANYVELLCGKINLTYDEGREYPGCWYSTFINRYNRRRIPNMISYERYLASEDIIQTIEGYGLDVNKFWVALCFIYDLSCDKTIDVNIQPNTMYEDAVGILEFFNKHKSVKILLTDANANNIGKKNSYTITSYLLAEAIRNIANIIVADEDNLEDGKHDILFTLPEESGNNLPQSYQIIYFQKMFETLFKLLELPRKRAYKGEGANYDKTLLISRLIYLCRLSTEKSYQYDTSTLRGLNSKYSLRGTKVISLVYT